MSELKSFVGLAEFSPGFKPRPNISHVLFDFDGTLSLIRQGWPEVMVPMFVEFIPEKEDEDPDRLRKMLFDDIMKLNGKQTIYQMIQFVERIRERGGDPKDPLWYKHEYLRRLDLKIANRIAELESGQVETSRYQVYMAEDLLFYLRELGLNLYLASGTDEVYVKKEVELLGLRDYFGDHVYGARDDYKSFSKKMCIERILKTHSIQGEGLLAFGDGYVEIENTKEVGGLAVAVASDEANNGSGRFDEWKRNRLRGVGADVIIPDYRDYKPLMKRILQGEA